MLYDGACRFFVCFLIPVAIFDLKCLSGWFPLCVVCCLTSSWVQSCLNGLKSGSFLNTYTSLFLSSCSLKVATFRSVYEYDCGFFVLSTRTFSPDPLRVLNTKTCTPSRTRTPIWRSLITTATIKWSIRKLKGAVTLLLRMQNNLTSWPKNTLLLIFGYLSTLGEAVFFFTRYKKI